MCMKRTNLVLKEDLLEAAVRVTGLKTYSATVNHALEEVLKLSKIRKLHEMLGAVSWEGRLSEMREDTPSKRSVTKKNKA